MATGTCFCGAVKVTVTGKAECHLICHCEDCRTWSGTVNLGCLYKEENTKFEGEMVSFKKHADKGWHRMCCAKCYSCVTGYHADLKVHDICASVLCGQKPGQMKFQPDFHLYYGERIKDMNDGLPKYTDYPTVLGGSGNTIAENCSDNYNMIGKIAPAVKGTAYMPDGSFQEIDTSVNKGKKYTVLYWYPLDFTFVCASELLKFSKKLKDFKERDCEVIGISVDSHFTHRAWCTTPKKDGGLEGGVNHPLLSDLGGDIGRNFGFMLKDAGVACRGVVLIDKEGVVQSQSANNLPLGRNVDEVLRILDALRHHEKSGDVCPANWKQGFPSMAPTKEGVTDWLQNFA